MTDHALDVARTHKELRRYLYNHKVIPGDEYEVQALFNARETALNKLLISLWGMVEDNIDRKHNEFMTEVKEALIRNSG